MSRALSIELRLGPTWGPAVYELIRSLVFIIAIVVPLMFCVAYLTLWERKAIGFTQIRLGPNRVGPLGLLQPIADALKLLTKEIIMPTAASKGLFVLGPIMTIMPALAAWADILVIAAVPTFTRAELLPDGNVRFHLSGFPDRQYEIEASTNLIAWTALQTMTAGTNGSFGFISTNSDGFAARFFRARTP